MTLDSTKTYTLIDKEQNLIGEIHSITSKENWFIGTAGLLSFPDQIAELFQRIEDLVKERDFRSVRQTEAELMSHQLQIKETGVTLSEFQVDKKKKVYFKLAC